jgi:hypothetical protein
VAKQRQTRGLALFSQEMAKKCAAAEENMSTFWHRDNGGEKTAWKMAVVMNLELKSKIHANRNIYSTGSFTVKKKY